MITAPPFPFLQAGFTVSSKQFKKAVDRNRIKRLMREAYRLQKNELEAKLLTHQQQLAIFFIYVGNDTPAYDQIFEKTGKALKKCINMIKETKVTNDHKPQINVERFGRKL